MTEYLSTREAACSLAISYHTLMGWIYNSKVRAVRRGWCWYIHRDEVERLRVERAS